MRRELFRARRESPRRPNDRCPDLRTGIADRLLPGQLQTGLTPADQFQIDRGQQIRVNQRPMQIAVAIVDLEPPAQPYRIWHCG